MALEMDRYNVCYNQMQIILFLYQYQYLKRVLHMRMMMYWEKLILQHYLKDITQIWDYLKVQYH